MSAIEKVNQDLVALRSSIGEALAFVRTITDEDSAGEAYDRVKLAKEWAKIRKVAKQVHVDLLRLEIHLLRKVAQLDALTAIPAVHRGTAKFYEHMSDEQIEALITAFGEGANPGRVMRRAQGESEASEERSRYTSGDYANQDRFVGDEARADAVAQYAGDLKAGLASVLEHYYEGDEGFSVYELAEQVSQAVGLDQMSAQWGAQQGLHEVCRKAVRDSPTVAIAGTDAPRFVTCISRATGYDVDLSGGDRPNWIRVPFFGAGLDQLRDMVSLRREQAEKATAVADSLEALYDQLQARLLPGERSRSFANIAPDVTLGELAARVAFAEPVAQGPEAGAA